MGITASRASLPADQKSYLDYYHCMSAKDYYAHLAAGTLDQFQDWSQRTVENDVGNWPDPA